MIRFILSLIIIFLANLNISAQNKELYKEIFLSLPIGETVDSIISTLIHNLEIKVNDEYYKDAVDINGQIIKGCIKYQGIFIGHDLLLYNTKNRISVFCNSSFPDDKYKYSLILDADFNELGKEKLLKDYKRLKRLFKKYYIVGKEGELYGDNFMGKTIDYQIDDKKTLILHWGNGDDIRNYNLNIQLSVSDE